MNEKKAKRLRIETRLHQETLYLRALSEYYRELEIWKTSEPPKYRIFKWLKWRLSKPERV